MILQYETATDEDIPVIFSQMKALGDAYEDLPSIEYDKVLAWCQRKICENIHHYTRVRLDGQICAYYRLCTDGELDDLYVLQPYRNCGIGSVIMGKVKHESTHPLHLYVYTRNTGAVRFYERHGFTVAKRVDNTRMIMSLNG